MKMNTNRIAIIGLATLCLTAFRPSSAAEKSQAELKQEAQPKKVTGSISLYPAYFAPASCAFGPFLTQEEVQDQTALLKKIYHISDKDLAIGVQYRLDDDQPQEARALMMSRALGHLPFFKPINLETQEMVKQAILSNSAITIPSLATLIAQYVNPPASLWNCRQDDVIEIQLPVQDSNAPIFARLVCSARYLNHRFEGEACPLLDYSRNLLSPEQIAQLEQRQKERQEKIWSSHGKK